MFAPRPGEWISAEEMLALAGIDLEAERTKIWPNEWTFEHIWRYERQAADAFVTAIADEEKAGTLTRERLTAWLATKLDRGLDDNFSSPAAPWLMEHPREALEIIGDLAEFYCQQPSLDLLTVILQGDFISRVSVGQAREVLKLIFPDVLTHQLPEWQQHAHAHLATVEMAVLVLVRLRTEEDPSHHSNFTCWLFSEGSCIGSQETDDAEFERPLRLPFKSFWRYFSPDQFIEALRICLERAPEVFVGQLWRIRAYFRQNNIHSLVALISRVPKSLAGKIDLASLDLGNDVTPPELKRQVLLSLVKGDPSNASRVGGHIENLFMEDKTDDAIQLFSELIAVGIVTAKDVAKELAQRTYWHELTPAFLEGLVSLLNRENYVVGQVRMGSRRSGDQEILQAEVWTEEFILVPDYKQRERTGYAPAVGDIVLANLSGRLLARRANRRVVATFFDSLETARARAQREEIVARRGGNR